MRQALRMQAKLMLWGKGFHIGLTIYLCFIVCVFVREALPMVGNDVANAIDPMFAYALHADADVAEVFAFLIPILAVLPFSASYAKDADLRYGCCILTRLSTRTYYWSKAILCFAGGFVILFLPLLLNILLNHLFLYPTGNSIYGSFGYLLFYDRLNPTRNFYAAERLFLEYPTIYTILSAGLAACYSGLCALASFAASFVLRRFRYLMVVPTLLVTVIAEVAHDAFYATDGYREVAIHAYLAIGSSRFKSYPLFFGYMLLLLCGSLGFIHMQIKKPQLH